MGLTFVLVILCFWLTFFLVDICFGSWVWFLVLVLGSWFWFLVLVLCFCSWFLVFVLCFGFCFWFLVFGSSLNYSPSSKTKLDCYIKAFSLAVLVLYIMRGTYCHVYQNFNA